MGLESSLMKDQDGNDIQDFYEMPNGCICCAAKDDLIITLDTLLEKKPELDYILVETSGLADPCQVIQTFWVDDGLNSKIELLQTVGVIDTFNFNKKLESTHVLYDELNKPIEFTEKDLLYRQLIYADQIILNKIDLIGEEKDAILERIKKIINALNPQVKYLESTYSQMPLDNLIQIDTKQQIRQIQDQNCCLDSHDHTHNHEEEHKNSSQEHIHSHHKQIENIDSVYFDLDGDKIVDKDRLEQLFGEILWEKNYCQRILRCKGTFIAKNEDGVLTEFILQGVEEVFEFRAIQNIQTPSDDIGYKNRFLLIGLKVEEKVIENKLKECLVSNQ
ncbi:UNKNOWN [Stylonychia lemnae]|uniref:Uncharacterized protein n=1 Tax=Stylonychia lemnae TaxID=5949 RepID=A0A078ABV9_STYLE|nr:UNKNOWN [Stylonychia lemnae]|eukprot:CDW78263.1 UNKNOWN [Stylonychia lemnae]